MEVLERFYVKLSKLAGNENDLFSSHSVDEANKVHDEKSSYRKKHKEVHDQK
jgi:hypothetical protein